nr:hypothetical protein [Tanacetum cinerariifolium]
MAAMAANISKLLESQTQSSSLLDVISKQLAAQYEQTATIISTIAQNNARIHQLQPPNNAPPTPHGLQIRPPKLNLSAFDGSNSLDWLFQANQYFSFYNITPPQRLSMIAFHLTGDALSWYKYLFNNCLLSTWEAFTRAFETRIGPSTYDNHQAAHFNLQQTFSQELAILRPHTITQAIGLAKLIEDKTNDHIPPPQNSALTAAPSPTSETLVINRLSPVEMQQRRVDGLCFNIKGFFACFFVGSTWLAAVGNHHRPPPETTSWCDRACGYRTHVPDGTISGKTLAELHLRKAVGDKDDASKDNTRRIINLSAPSHRMPTNLKIYDGSTDPDDHITRFVGAANQGGRCRYGVGCSSKPWMGLQGVGSIECPTVALTVGRTSRKGSWRGLPYEGGVARTQLKSQRLFEKPTKRCQILKNVGPRKWGISKVSRRKENLHRYCDYHGEKGHYNNDCYQLKRQLEVALESEKLNHLIKDVRQRGGNRGNHTGNKSTHGKVINMAHERGDSRKSYGGGRLPRPASVCGLRRSGASNVRTLFPVVSKSRNEIYSSAGVFPVQHHLGRTGIRELRVFSSTTHAMMKFPTLRGIATLVSRTAAIFECRQLESKQTLPGGQLKEGAAKSIKSLTEEEVMINPVYPNQKVTIGTQFSSTSRSQLINVLKDNKDVFAWQPMDMDGVPRRISQHSLNVNASVTPLAQKRKVLGPKKSNEVTKEVEEWTKAGIVQLIKGGRFGLSSASRKEPRAVCGRYGYQKQNGEGHDNGYNGTFDNLRKVNMKLNLKKCSFGGMQSLSGKLVALNRFLSRSAERALPFFDTLKNITKENKDDFRWTEEAEHAFQELKKLIMKLPMLTTRGVKETLYFEAHLIKVITDQPIKQILNKPEVSKKLPKYAIELGAYNITYMPRNAIKGQVLADFLNEVPVRTKHLEICSLTNDKDPETWIMFTDGVSSLKGAGVELILIDLMGTEYTYAIRLNFSSTNNEAEYEALLVGLRIARKMKAKELSTLFKRFSIENVPHNHNQKADVLSKLASVALNHLTKEVLVKVLNAKSREAQEMNSIVKEEGDN